MLPDALPPRDLKCPTCPNTSLGLQRVDYLREWFQNMVAWKV